MFFQLLSRCCEKGAPIITRNKSFVEWGTALGDEVLATAVLDRFLHHFGVIAINGRSYRLKDRADLVNTAGEPAPKGPSRTPTRVYPERHVTLQAGRGTSTTK